MQRAELLIILLISLSQEFQSWNDPLRPFADKAKGTCGMWLPWSWETLPPIFCSSSSLHCAPVRTRAFKQVGRGFLNGLPCIVSLEKTHPKSTTTINKWNMQPHRKIIQIKALLDATQLHPMHGGFCFLD